MLDDWKEFEADLRAALEPSLVSQKPGKFATAAVPGVLAAALGSVDITWLETIAGWDVGGGEFSPGRFQGDPDELPLQPGLYAWIEGDPAVGTRFERGQRDAARALFEGMSKAGEITTVHVAPERSYDRTWTRIRRASPKQRLVCQHVIDPTARKPVASYSCHITRVTRSQTRSSIVKQCLR